MKRIFVGVDVGLKGALCFIDGNETHVFDMPKREEFTQIANLFEAIPNDVSIVGIEAQNPFPGQGVISVYSLGWQVGYLDALLDYLKIPYQEVRAAKWMGFFGLQGKKKEGGKEKLYTTAKRLYPHVNFCGPKGALKDGRVDATLLAHYMKQHYKD